MLYLAFPRGTGLSFGEALTMYIIMRLEAFDISRPERLLQFVKFEIEEHLPHSVGCEYSKIPSEGMSARRSCAKKLHKSVIQIAVVNFILMLSRNFVAYYPSCKSSIADLHPQFCKPVHSETRLTWYHESRATMNTRSPIHRGRDRATNIQPHGLTRIGLQTTRHVSGRLGSH
jgi:hypothetical protein